MNYIVKNIGKIKKIAEVLGFSRLPHAFFIAEMEHAEEREF